MSVSAAPPRQSLRPPTDGTRSGAKTRIRVKSRRDPATVGAIPFLLLIAGFFAVPVVGMTIVAFTGSGTEAGVSLANFAAALSGTGLLSITNSLLVSAVSAAIAAVVGGILAFLISRIRHPAVEAGVAIVSSVLANSGGVMLAFSFIVMLGNAGVLTAALGLDRFGFTLYSWSGLVVMYQYFLIPTMVLVTLPAFAGIRSEWVQASQALGGGARLFWQRVGLPVAAPSLLGGWVLLFGAAFATHASPAVLLGTGGYPLVPLTIANQLNGGAASGREGTAMALGLIMVVVAIISLTLSSHLQQRSLKWLR